MTVKAIEFPEPILGRIVWGDLYDPNTKDFDGNRMTIKKGPDTGKETQRYEFGLAVPKTQAHFANEPGWGQLIWSTAHAAFPGLAALMDPIDSGSFSWKITDGDSAKVPPKSKTKIPPNAREGFKGHWVLKFSSSFAPQIFDARDLGRIVPLDGKDAIVPGYVVLVDGSIAGNTGNSPGIYINHRGVALRAYLAPIVSAGGVNPDRFAKSTAALPAGATAIPVGTAALPQPAAPSASPAPAPLAITPIPGLAGIPGPFSAPPPPSAAPAAPPARAPHKGHAYDSYIKAGWSHEQLVADGYVG